MSTDNYFNSQDSSSGDRHWILWHIGFYIIFYIIQSVSFSFSSGVDLHVREICTPYIHILCSKTGIEIFVTVASNKHSRCSIEPPQRGGFNKYPGAMLGAKLSK